MLLITDSCLGPYQIHDLPLNLFLITEVPWAQLLHISTGMHSTQKLPVAAMNIDQQAAN
jgi:hypothetical protein